MSKYFTLLQNENYRRFISALTILNIGRKLSWVALGWFVFQLTGSSLALGSVITAATVSPLLSSIFVGGILDRYNRKTIMIIENVSRGFLLSVIPLLYWMDLLTVFIIIVVVFLNGIISSFTSIGTSSILPSFLKEEELETGNAVYQMVWQVSYLIGPALGGLSTALVGAPMTLLINVFCFFFAAWLYFLIPYEAYHVGMDSEEDKDLGQRNKVIQFMNETTEGFRFIRKYSILVMLAFVTLFFNMTYGPLEPMLPIYVDEILRTGPEVLGVLWTVFAVGSIIGSALWVQWKKVFPYSYVLGIIIMFWGSVPLLLGLISVTSVAYGLMFFGGVVYAPYNIVSPTLRQRLVPNYLRGRVFGVYGVISGIGLPIGVFIGGWLGSVIGTSMTIFYSGVTTILLGMIVFLHPVLRVKSDEITSLGKNEFKNSNKI